MVTSRNEARVILSAQDKTGPAFKTVQSSLGATLRSSQLLSTAVGSLATGFSVTAIVGYARGLAQAGNEAERFARLANTNVERFQAEAFAVERAGISQEKYADILKDTQDKVGDFLQNGAGPLKDFFDNIAPKVGVTAEQFRKLGGSDALQLYVSSLQKANLSQSELTFYMEAIASDSALLLPLLRDNGTEMKRLGDEAGRLGRVLSQEAIAEIKRFDEELRSLTGAASGFGRNVAIPIIGALNDVIEQFRLARQFSGSFYESLFRTGTSNPAERIVDLEKKLKRLNEEASRPGLVGLPAARARDAVASAEKDLALLQEVLRRQEVARIAPRDDLRRFENSERASPAAPPPGRTTPARSGAAPRAARAPAEIIRPDAELDAISAEFDRLFDQRDERARRSAQIYQDLLTPIELLAQKEAELDTLRSAGLISEETLARARMVAAEEYADAMDRAAGKTTEAVELVDELSQASLQAAERMQDALGDQLFNALDGRFSDIGDAFGNMIKRMVAEALSANIMDALFGAVRTSSSGLNSRGGGWLGDLGTAFLGSFLPGFSGGGYTGSGARAGGMDGQGGFLAMLHPRETVVDHTKGGGMAAPIINIYNTIGSVASQADVVAGMQQTRAQIMGELQRSRTYGGAAA